LTSKRNMLDALNIPATSVCKADVVAWLTSM
jgi:hypothetical protein